MEDKKMKVKSESKYTNKQKKTYKRQQECIHLKEKCTKKAIQEKPIRFFIVTILEKLSFCFPKA